MLRHAIGQVKFWYKALGWQLYEHRKSPKISENRFSLGFSSVNWDFLRFSEIFGSRWVCIPNKAIRSTKNKKSKITKLFLTNSMKLRKNKGINRNSRTRKSRRKGRSDTKRIPNDTTNNYNCSDSLQIRIAKARMLWKNGFSENIFLLKMGKNMFFWIRFE